MTVWRLCARAVLIVVGVAAAVVGCWHTDPLLAACGVALFIAGSFL